MRAGALLLAAAAAAATAAAVSAAGAASVAVDAGGNKKHRGRPPVPREQAAAWHRARAAEAEAERRAAVAAKWRDRRPAWGVEGVPTREAARAALAGRATPLTVHMVPHTHDDVGWLKTVDEYFTGSQNSIYAASVSDVLDSVMVALAADPARRFTYVEMAYFWRWWSTQTAATRSTVAGFVASGQLTFANGGWCMHDESAPTYNDMVDQTTMGHRFLAEAFGAVPTVGWQIDPFGHSGTQGSLLGAPAGFTSLFFARSHYADYSARANTSQLEFMWQPSASYGRDARLFTGILWGAMYAPPPLLDYDYSSFLAIPVVTDAALEGYNVAEVLDYFLDDVALQSWYTRGDDIMILMGSDFEYRAALIPFKNLDRLIAAATADGTVRAVYSTPAAYAAAKLASGVAWNTTANTDFFPYADEEHGYWTGYMTSRPALKGYVRAVSAYTRAAVQLTSWAGAASTVNTSDPLFPLRDALYVAQHHDAVAGTEKQAVAFDYAARLAAGVAAAAPVVSAALTARVAPPPGALGAYTLCPTANVTICVPLEGGTPQVLSLYNSLAQALPATPVRLPVAAANATATFSYVVLDAAGVAVATQLSPASPLDLALRANAGGNPAVTPAWLTFLASLPPAGYTSFVVLPTASPHAAVPAARVAAAPAAPHGLRRSGDVATAVTATAVVSNGYLAVAYNNATGAVTGLTNTVSGATAALTAEVAYYASSFGDLTVSLQPSGAYIFRPNISASYAVAPAPASFDVVTGPLVTELRTTYAPWAAVTWRLYANASYVEVESTIGPVPIGDWWGKEVVLRLNSSLASNTSFVTDANGRELYPRTTGTLQWGGTPDEPYAGNYYPVNTLIALGDATATLSLVTDRSQGGSSLAPGSLEVMLHRRLLDDDARGVGEPLNETDPATGLGLIVRSTHRLQLERPTAAPAPRRAAAQSLLFTPQALLAPLSAPPATFLAAATPAWTALTAPLPPNAHLLTAEVVAPGVLLVRLAHVFGAGEDAVLSQNVTVALPSLFATVSLLTAQETTLTANAPLGGVADARLPWPHSLLTAAPPPGPVTLSPLQVRTFLCTYTPATPGAPAATAPA